MSLFKIRPIVAGFAAGMQPRYKPRDRSRFEILYLIINQIVLLQVVVYTLHWQK